MGNSRRKEAYFGEEEKNTIYTTIHEIDARISDLRHTLDNKGQDDFTLRVILVTLSGLCIIGFVIYKLATLADFWKTKLCRPAKPSTTTLQIPYPINMPTEATPHQRPATAPITIPRIRWED